MDKSKYARLAESDCIAVGIVPLKLFVDKSIYASLVTLDIDGGIVPLKLFVDKSIYARLVTLDIDGGIVPLKLYPAISNLDKSVRTDSEDKYNRYD